MGECPAQVLSQAGPHLPGEGLRCLQQLVELLGAAGQPEALKLCWTARSVLAQQYEVPGVCHEHQPVPGPVSADLVTLGDQPGVVADRLDFDHSALGELSLAWLPLLYLPGCVQANVGMPRALLRHLADAENLGFEGAAHRVQQIGQGWVVRTLTGRPTGRADVA